MKYCYMLAALFISLSVVFAQNPPKSAFVLNSVANTLSVINLENNQVIVDTLSSGANSYPNDIEIRNNRGYVLNSGTNSIMVFDIQTLHKIKTIPLPNGVNPWSICFVSDSLAAVSFFVTDEIGLVNVYTNQVEQIIRVGIGPEGIAYKDNRLYVANSGYINYIDP